MKQTNNAIKFLMAQYRAIFKNANLKMFLAAATAAAAMAAGQAQAASPLNTDALWKALEGAKTVGAADSDYTKIEIEADASKFDNPDKEFTLSIVGGENTIAGSVDSAAVKAASGTVILNGSQASLKIGGVATKSGASVTLKEFKALAGNLSIGGSDQQSALDAGTITLLGAADSGKATKAASPAVTVKLGKSGALGGSNSKITIGTGAALSLEKGATKSSINGSNLLIQGGIVNVDTGLTLDVHSAKVQVLDGSDFSNAGTVKFDKATEVSFAADTVKNSGTIELNKDGAIVTVAASDFSSTGLFQNQGKITATGSDANKTYTIKLSGDGDVDLGLLLSGDGSKKSDHVDIKTGKLSIEGASATFSGNKIAVLTGVKFGSLTAGSGDALTIDGTAVTIGKSLTVPTAKDGEFGTLTLDNAGALHLAGNGGTVNAKTLTIGGTGKGVLSVDSGNWNASSLLITSGSATVDTGATLVIASGDLTTRDKDNLLTVKGTLDASNAGKVTLAESGAALTGGKLILDKSDVFTVSGDTVTLLTGGNGSKFDAKGVSGDAASVLQINNVGALSSAAIKDFKSKIQGFDGFLQFGGDSQIASESGKKTWNDIKDNARVSGIYSDVTLTEDTISGSASIGNIEVQTESKTEATIQDAIVILNNASANGSTGKFVANKDGSKTLGINLANNSSNVIFVSTGEVGSIKTATKDKNSVAVGHVNGEGHVTVVGGVGDALKPLAEVSVLAGSSLKIAGEAADGLYANKLNLDAGASLDASGHDIVLGSGDVVSTLKGKLDAKSLTLGGTGAHTIAGGALVTVETLNGAASGTINVGQDSVENGSASVQANSLVLNGGTLNIDPEYGQHYASVRTMKLSGASGDTLDGLVNVGKNSVLAIGFDKVADVDAALGELIANGSFKNPTPPAGTPATAADPVTPAVSPLATNALVLNKQISVDKDKGGLHIGSKGTTQADKNKFIVDSDGAMVITDAVYSVDPATGKKTGDAITLDSNATLSIANGATVYLVGSFNGADDNLSILKGPGSVATQLKNFKVKVGSDLLVVAQNPDGTFDISLTTDKARLATAFTDSSTPVRDLLLDVLDGHKIPFSTEAGYKFLDSVAKNPAKLGAAADAAAHAATYAGAQQAAVASVTTMAEAVGSRIGGLGVEATAIQATGSQANGGVWLTPMYKTVDADGFGAQGATYGADVDLAGVAFGTDTVNGNMRFGAVFNIGSGDADGKGNGNGLKDEFDYYGFGMYSVMGFGNFALVGDASLNVISHEVEGFGLKGEADTTAVTMGVTGQYTISNPMVDVTPHLGARFIRLDTDSYDLTSADGVIANTDFDVQNVFSVPLGVTLSKAFEMGGWALAPSADLSITFNTGDTDVESATYFTGAKAINLTTEVLDEVTYGVALGLGAQYGAFGTSINVNYTGSENTDAFGVNAQARYMF